MSEMKETSRVIRTSRLVAHELFDKGCSWFLVNNAMLGEIQLTIGEIVRKQEWGSDEIVWCFAPYKTALLHKMTMLEICGIIRQIEDDESKLSLAT